jgi:RNA polymerase sigma-70 factor (ECF subfamily)
MKHLSFNNLSDEIIIEKIIHENTPDFFEVLHRRYYLKVRDKCYTFLKDKRLSEEFANDILCKVYEKLGTFKGKSSFSSWLYSITYNMVIDYLRKKKQLHYPNWNQDNELPEIIDETDSDLEEIDYDRLMHIFEMIHPEEKALLLMKYQDSLSLKLIASTLSISEDAVKMRLKRARSRVVFLYFEKYGNK